MPKIKKLYVEGMHCPSCEIYIENKLKDFKYISNVKSNHKKQTVTFTLEREEGEKDLIEDINRVTKKDGYTVQKYNETKSENKGENNRNILFKSFFIALGILLVFYLLQRLNIFQNLKLSENNYLTAFLIGIVASFSSCMAVVGSIIITISTKQEKASPLIILHISRIIAFFVLGGLLGLIGSVFVLTNNFHTISGIILFVVMLLMGLSLLDIFPSFKNVIPKLPKSLTSKTFKNNTSPLLLGIITFLLPCGFTQSMQIVAISTGNILEASLTMFLFALGTLPVLAFLSFGVISLREKVNTQLLFKTSGFLIIFFALYTLLTLLISLGIITVLL